MPRNPVLRNAVARSLPPTFDVRTNPSGTVLIKPKQWQEVLCQADRLIDELERVGYQIVISSRSLMPWCDHCGCYHHDGAPHIQQEQSK